MLPKAKTTPETFDAKYIYDVVSDTYLTFIAKSTKPIHTSGEVHRKIIEAYSNQSGKSVQKADIAAELDFPLLWLGSYLRAHKITRDQAPFSKEQLETETVEELVELVKEQRRRKTLGALASRQSAVITKNAAKWENFDETVLESIRDLLKYEPAAVTKVQLKSPEKDFAVVLSPTDLHWGKYGWEDETGEEYNREVTRERLITHTNDLLSRVTRFGKPDKIYLTIGSDWFNCDNAIGATTSGTLQDNDGTFVEILTSGYKMAVEHIDMLRQVSDVELVSIPGNHDSTSALTLFLYLQAWYRGCEGITFTSSHQDRQYVTYGSTLIGFSHGDGTKPANLGPLMSKEAKKLWGVSEHQVWFTGHLHTESVHDRNGVMHYSLPSLSGSDRWHSRKGFTLNRKALNAYIIDCEEGVIATLSSAVQPVKD